MILMTAHVGYCTQLCLQQAVIKAMLNSPTADQGGFQNLFSVVELRHLAQREAKLMQRVKEANESIILVDTYLRAYGKFPQQVLQRLVSVLEVKCVMHAFNKKQRPEQATPTSFKLCSLSWTMRRDWTPVCLFFQRSQRVQMQVRAARSVLTTACDKMAKYLMRSLRPKVSK